jgi:Protein of unknown function (DUF3996)
MKKILLTLLIFLSILINIAAQEQKWAVGARLGEPAGLNIRKYFDQNAIDINIGTYGGLWGGYRSYRKGHYKSVGLAVNVNYLWHNNLFKKEQLKSYYGFGAQFNNRKYTPNAQNTAEGVATLSIGGSGVAGIEYFLKDSPISIFLETGLYVEILPSPIFMHIQSGAGARFNF